MAGNSSMRAKQWFLTYPHCPLEPAVVLKCLEPLGVQDYVIAKEQHKNGEPHIHAYIKLKEKVRFKAALFDLLDLGKLYHGNYQSVKNYDNVVAYCTKDSNFIANIDVTAREKHKSKLLPSDYARDPLDLLAENKISFMQLNNFVKNQDTFKLLSNKKKRPPEPEDMPDKRRHEWIYGESNTGKTTYLRQMMKEVPGGWFQIPYNNDWKGYGGELNLYADEFKGQLTIQNLNLACDGGAKMNTKGGTTQLDWCCKVWICSNYSISRCYRNADAELLDCLYNRFEEKEFLRSDWEKKKKDEE